MNKFKLLFVLLAVIMLYNTASAQESITPDISPVYLDKLIALAKANYPKVKSTERKIEEAKANVGKANASYLDAFSVSYVYQPKISTVINGATVQSQFNGFQAGVFFNFGTFFEKPFAAKAAKQEELIANDERDEYLLTLTELVKKAYYTYVADQDYVKLVTESTQDATNVLTDVKHKFEKGEETFDNYTRAQAGVTASYQAKIGAETNLLIAKADLEELVGVKLEDIK